MINQDAAGTLNKVLPKIQQELFHGSSEFQIQTSHVFQLLIENHIYAAEGQLTGTLIQSLDSKDPVVANAWLGTLLEVIPLLPLKRVQAEVILLTKCSACYTLKAHYIT